MDQFKYDGQIIAYHSFNKDMDRCIIPLGKPGGKTVGLYEFASVFGAPDKRGFRFKVLWMEYGEESDYDKAAETLKMMEDAETEKSIFAVFDREGAGILSEINKLTPGSIETVYAAEDNVTDIRKQLEEIPGLPEIEYCYAPDPENLFVAIRNSLFGQKMNCPYCGEPMQMGYIYAPQSIQAYWTPNQDLIGDVGVIEEKDKILPMREDMRDYDSLGELLTGVSHEDVARGFLCRRCGKMVVDMSHVLIRIKDKTYFEANGLPADYQEADEVDDGSGLADSISALGGTLKNMFGRKKADSTEAKYAKKARKQGYAEDDEPKRRGLFGGPKVE